MFFAMFLFFLGIEAALSSTKQESPANASCWRRTICTPRPTKPFGGKGRGERWKISPYSRIVKPWKVLHVNGSIFDPEMPLTLNVNQYPIIYDFGIEVGGVITVNYSASGPGTLDLAFSEARNFTGRFSDDSNGAFNTDGFGHADGAITFGISATSEATYTVPDAQMRGGFRYLSLFIDGNDVDIEILGISCEISFQPSWSNLRAYGGYFVSSDELLDYIWSAGAYTLQTNAVPPSTGRAFPIVGSGWNNNIDLNLGTSGTTIYVDGSKRDRTIWPGDLVIAIPSILVSTGDYEGVRNTLQVLYNDQAYDGALPFAGPGINSYNSDTYHMATLIATHDYYLFTGDDEFMKHNWQDYKYALNYIAKKLDDTNMLYVTGAEDWGRLKQGGRNTEANMLMYRTLVTGGHLHEWMEEADTGHNLLRMAEDLKTAMNSNNWDASVGAFKDSDIDGSIHPQDGNSMALLFSAANESFIDSISTKLHSNWISIGSVAPELPGNLVGFGQSFEVKGHFIAKQAIRALNLIRRAWGWYIIILTARETLAPAFGDLDFAAAGFTTPLGEFEVTWGLQRDGNGYRIEHSFPLNTAGFVILPGFKTGNEVFYKSCGKPPCSLPAGVWDKKAQTMTFTIDNSVSRNKNYFDWRITFDG